MYLVKMNRKLLDEKYLQYAEFVLFHEYIHCLGNFSHDKNFRQLENLWPEKKQMNIIGRQLTRDLQKMKANKSDDNLIWIDLEMTGLDPEKE